MWNKSNINIRALMAFGHDVVATAVCWCLAYWLRFNLEIPQPFLGGMLANLPWVLLIQSSVFWWFGLYRGIWRYASLPDLKRILAAVVFATVIVAAALFLTQHGPLVPRSVLLLDPLLLVIVMGGSRFGYRVWKEHHLYGPFGQKGEPVIVLGAGVSAVNLVKDLARSQEWRVVGILDDNPAKFGRQLHGIKVLGRLDELPVWAAMLKVKQAIIAMPSVSHGLRRRAAQVCADAGIKALTVPSFDDLMSGKVTIAQIREIEVEDLLGRDPVTLDDKGLQDFLAGRVVMVTGAGGSIGAELCRQVARFKPSLLVLFELSEYALYRMEQELELSYPEMRAVYVIGDVKDRARLDQVFQSYRPAVVFHAAAYKHVPLMERDNAWAAVMNNVLGTYILGRAAMENGVEEFVLISTDKAVNPTNVMGASKRMAEMVCQSLHKEGGMCFVMVRFGNVLGSTGSVIPKFQKQIARGGPITVTHPEITRYFMSLSEAAQLVLQAGMMGKGGEIFVMDMGEPVKIAELARDMIRLSGFNEDDIKIVFSGLRPGEKLYEELLADDEHTLPTPHPKLRIAQARQVSGAWLDTLLQQLDQQGARDDQETRDFVFHWVPEYTEFTATAAPDNLA